MALCIGLSSRSSTIFLEVGSWGLLVRLRWFRYLQVRCWTPLPQHVTMPGCVYSLHVMMDMKMPPPQSNACQPRVCVDLVLLQSPSVRVFYQSASSVPTWGIQLVISTHAINQTMPRCCYQSELFSQRILTKRLNLSTTTNNI